MDSTSTRSKQAVISSPYVRRENKKRAMSILPALIRRPVEPRNLPSATTETAMEAITQRGILNVNSIERAGAVSSSRKAQWAGRLMSGLAILFLAFDTLGKVLGLAPVIQGTTELGYAESAVFTLGLIELVCVVLYVIPRTSVLGAILLTGWFGGAIATHLRLGSPLFSHTLFPIYVALLVWGGLSLSSERVRALLSLRVRR
jgi:hypothetical protein